MFLTCCGCLFSKPPVCGSLSKKCFKRAKQITVTRRTYFVCSADSVEEKESSIPKASSMSNLLFQNADLQELKKELRDTLETAFRKAKDKGDFKLTKDELRILDDLEKQGEEELKNILEKLKEHMDSVLVNEEQKQILSETVLKQESMLQAYDRQVDTLFQVMQQERKNLEEEKRLIKQLRKQYEEYLQRKEAVRPNTIPKVLLLASAITFGFSCLYYVWVAFGTDQNDNLQNAVWNALATVVAVQIYERQTMKK